MSNELESEPELLDFAKETEPLYSHENRVSWKLDEHEKYIYVIFTDNKIIGFLDGELKAKIALKYIVEKMMNREKRRNPDWEYFHETKENGSGITSTISKKYNLYVFSVEERCGTVSYTRIKQIVPRTQ